MHWKPHFEFASISFPNHRAKLRALVLTGFYLSFHVNQCINLFGVPRIGVDRTIIAIFNDVSSSRTNDRTSISPRDITAILEHSISLDDSREDV